MKYTTVAFLASFLAAATAAPAPAPESPPMPTPEKKPTICKPVYPGKPITEIDPPVYPATSTTPEPPVNTVITEFRQLQIFVNENAPANFKEFDGLYLKRQTDGPLKDRVSLRTTGDFFKEDWSTEEGGMYISYGRHADGSSSTEVAQPVVFTSEKTGVFVVRDDTDAQFTFRTFSGWQVCTDMKSGPYLYYTSTGFKEQAGCTSCRVSVAKSAII